MEHGHGGPVVMKSERTGAGNSVVLVPGGLTGWLSWEPHAKQLSQGYRVSRVQLLSVDLGLRGEPLPPNYSVDYEATALTRTLDQEGIARAHFIPWSYGAEITLHFALDHPDRIRTLTLIEPPAVWVLRSRAPLSGDVLTQQKTLRSLGPGDVNESQLEWFLHFAGIIPPAADPKTLPQWPVWVKHRQSLRTGDLAFRHHDDIRRVRGFNRPVLLVKGEGSASFLHQIIDILGGEFPNARVEKLPGGHAPQLGSMGKFMEILAAFLKS